MPSHRDRPYGEGRPRRYEYDSDSPDDLPPKGRDSRREPPRPSRAPTGKDRYDIPPTDPRDLPVRGGRPDDIDPYSPVAARPPPRGGRKPRYDDSDSDVPPPPRTRGGPYRDDRGYRSEGHGYRDEPPRRSRGGYGGGGRGYDDESDDYDPRDRYGRSSRRHDDYDRGGYRSDRAGGRRGGRYDDYDDYDRRDKYGGRSGGRDKYKRSSSKARYRDDSRDRKRGGGGGNNWQREAGDLFAVYAMPVIKKEGGRFVQQQVAKYLAQKKG